MINHLRFKSICLSMLALIVAFPVAAQLSPRQIMEKVDTLQRQVSDKNLSLSTLSSCAFKVVNKKIACSETKRVKRFESFGIQLGENKKDSKNISIILEPAREKGVGMLTYSYEDDNIDTESWLYLSALGKVKRMVSGSGDDQEPVSFFGSEFTTEDMESGKTDEYEYKVLQEGKYGKSEVWVIEAKPKPKRLKKTNYSKLLLWIEKQRFVPLKVQSYDKYGKLHKRTLMKEYESVNNLWVARKVTVFNLRDKRLSTISTEQIVLGVELDDEFLTQRSLSDFAFRERHLEVLREHFK